jgi:ribosomal-protein-serine acetyltransferase
MIPNIRTFRLADGPLLLRPYLAGDADAVFEAALESIVKVNPWLSWCHPGYTKGESKSWIKTCRKSWTQGTAYEFAIIDGAHGGFLGGCGLNNINAAYKMANLGYWVRSSRTGHGIATGAARIVARFGFQALGLNRIEIIAAVENKASQRVAERAGAKREAVLRNRIILNGQVVDGVMFSFIPQDFEAAAVPELVNSKH